MPRRSGPVSRHCLCHLSCRQVRSVMHTSPMITSMHRIHGACKCLLHNMLTRCEWTHRFVSSRTGCRAPPPAPTQQIHRANVGVARCNGGEKFWWKFMRQCWLADPLPWCVCAWLCVSARKFVSICLRIYVSLHPSFHPSIHLSMSVLCPHTKMHSYTRTHTHTHNHTITHTHTHRCC